MEIRMHSWKHPFILFTIEALAKIVFKINVMSVSACTKPFRGEKFDF